MGEDPTAIRQQIEETRERMGDTVDALGYKADVPARAKDSLSEKVGGVRAKLSGTGGQIADAAPGSEDLARTGRQAVGVVQENPLGLAIGAAAVGFLAGMLVPSTRVENERIGPMADQVKEQVRQTGQEALERGRQVAQDTVQSATDSAQQVVADARESAQQQADELKSSAQENAQDAAQAAKR